MDVRKTVEQQIGAHVLALIEAQAEIESLKAAIKATAAAKTEPQAAPGYEGGDQEGVS